MHYNNRLRRLERPNDCGLAVVLSTGADEHKVNCPGHPLDGCYINAEELERFRAQFKGQLTVIDDFSWEEQEVNT